MIIIFTGFLDSMCKERRNITAVCFICRVIRHQHRTVRGFRHMFGTEFREIPGCYYERVVIVWAAFAWTPTQIRFWKKIIEYVFSKPCFYTRKIFVVWVRWFIVARRFWSVTVFVRFGAFW